MTDSKDQAQSLFLNALEIPTEGERAAYVAAQCGADPELRQEVEELLDHARRLGPFLEPGDEGVDGTIAHPISERPGAVIGPYKLLQQVGEGGMGVVFMAEQTRPVQRTVALKIIKPGMDTRQVIARFEAERQALALMDHPNIARVLDVGATDAGRPYFVMDLVKGVPITDYCDHERLPVRQRLELFAQVCHAVQHAHQKGIIHRDLKPSNVLVAEYDGKPVPKIIDFGVAKATAQRLTEKTMFTELGQVVGTVEYMSPEQARFNQLDVDTRSDVYSLGVLLYELLTGSTPFGRKRLNEAAFDEMLRIIREEEPPKPSTRLSSSDALPSIAANRGLEPLKLNRIVQGELDWIVMKCLEKDRDRRYETANALTMDLQRYLTDQPVEARAATRMYRLNKFIRRNMAGVLAGSAIVAALAAGLALASIGFIQARNQARIAEAEAANATAAQDRAEAALIDTDRALHEKDNALKLAEEKELLQRRRFYAAQMNLAQQALAAGEPTRVLDILEQNRPRPGEADLRGFEWHYLWNEIHPGLRRSIFWPEGRAHRGLAYSPDGSMLAISGGSGVMPGVVKLLDADTGQVKQTFSGEGLWGFGLLAFSPDASALASAWSHHRVVVLWNVVDGSEIARSSTQAGPVRSLRFSPNGKRLAAGCDNGVVIFDGVSLKTIARLNQHDPSISSVSYSPDGTRLYSAEASITAGVVLTRVYDLTKSPPELVDELRDFRVTDVSPDGRYLVGGWQRTAAIWDIAAEEFVWQVAAHPESINDLRYMPDGNSFISIGNEDRMAIMWDIAKREAVMWAPHPAAVMALACAPEEKQAWASLSDDGTIKIWENTPRRDNSTVRLEQPILQALVVPNDGTMILGGEFPAKTWDLDGGKQIGQALPATQVRSISADGRLLVSTEWLPSEEKVLVKIWDIRSGDVWKIIPILDRQRPTNVCISPDGKYLAVTDAEGPIEIWNLADKPSTTLSSRAIQYRHPVWWNPLPCKHLAFSPDNRWLGAAYEMGKVNLYDLQTKQIVPLPLPEAPWATIVAFSRDSKLLASGNDLGVATVFDTEVGEVVASFPGHEAAITALAFFPDGRTLATGSRDTIRLWDLPTQQERITLQLEPGAASDGLVTVEDLAVTADGGTLISRQNNGAVHVWNGTVEAAARTITADAEIALPAAGTAQDASFFAHRAIAQAGLRHWDQALADIQQAGRLRFVWDKYPLTILSRALSTESEFANPQDAAAAQKIRRYVLSLVARATDPSALNDAAWNLASIDAPHPDAVKLAIAMAEKAIELVPDNDSRSSYGDWMGIHIDATLGVAYYRAGRWQAAIESLHRALEHHPPSWVPLDGYFLAMAYAKLGDRESAMRWFRACDRVVAVVWWDHQEMLKFRAEAAEVLGLKLEPLEQVQDTPEEREAIVKLFVDADPQATWPKSLFGTPTESTESTPASPPTTDKTKKDGR